MADVTDSVFRRIVAETAKPDVLFTEFTSADGLAHPKAREKLLVNLRFSEIERPVVAQIFGARPENIKKAAALCAELGFDGVDINMGCPDRKIEKQGAGAAMIKNPQLAREVIQAAKEGAPNLPISVKTRMGYSSLNEFHDWFNILLSADLAAITVHLRTRKEMSKVPAHWELGRKLRDYSAACSFGQSPQSHYCETVASLGRRDSHAAATGQPPGAPKEQSGGVPSLLANGDVEDLDDARKKAIENDLDGVMLGRAIFGNPWLFVGKRKEDIPWDERLHVLIYHTELFETEYKGVKNFSIMKKFYGAYVSGHPQAHDFKAALMTCNNAADVREVVTKFAV